MTERHPIPDEILIDHLAVLAKTGAGKTYMAKGLVERLLEQKRRVCIVDPKNAWWGLKSSADGKSPAFPIVIFGGPKADVPLLPAHGKILGEAVATAHLSCIICTKGMPEAERIRFLTDFFQTLDQKNSQPLHLVLDEAHMMAPQKPLGEMQRLTHWTSELVSGGRGMGFRIILLSQRPARLNKDVLTQCETLVAMRMTGIQDRDAVKSWIHDQADMEKGKEIVASLTGLQNGEGWVWSPAKDILKSVKFPLITTYDNSKTSRDSKADDRAELAPVDLSALQDKLGKVKGEIEANDPKALKAKIADLQKQLAAKPSNQGGKINAADETRLRSEGYNAGWAAAMKDAAKREKALINPLATAAMLLDRAKAVITDAQAALRDSAPAPVPAPVRRAPVSAAPRPSAPAASARLEPIGDLDGPQTRIMHSLGKWLAIGFEDPTKAQVAVFADYSAGSPSFRNSLGALQSAGLIQHGDGRARLTDEGKRHPAAKADAIAGRDELHDVIRQRLDGPQLRIFNALLEIAPDGQEATRADVAAKANYEAGSPSFRNSLGALRTMEVIDYGKGTVFLRPWVIGDY